MCTHASPVNRCWRREARIHPGQVISHHRTHTRARTPANHLHAFSHQLDVGAKQWTAAVARINVHSPLISKNGLTSIAKVHLNVTKMFLDEIIYPISLL